MSGKDRVLAQVYVVDDCLGEAIITSAMSSESIGYSSAIPAR